MADTWEQRLERWLDPDQVRRGDAAIVAAIDALPGKLGTAHAAGGTGGSASAPGSAATGAHPPASIATQWSVGAGATQTTIPVVIAASGQTPQLSAQMRAALVGATVTFISGSALGQSDQIAAVSSQGVLTLRSALPIVPQRGDRLDLASPPILSGVSSSSAWLDTWVNAGEKLALTSPWGGTIGLQNIGLHQPVHLVIDAGFTGSVSGTMDHGGAIALGANCATAITLPMYGSGSIASTLRLTVGPNSSGSVTAKALDDVVAELGAMWGGSLTLDTVGTQIRIGDNSDVQASVSGGSVIDIGGFSSGKIVFPTGAGLGKVTVGNSNTGNLTLKAGVAAVTIGEANAGDITCDNSDGVTEIGDANSGTISLTGGDNIVKIGDANAGTITVASADNVVVVGDNNAASIDMTVFSGDTILRVSDNNVGSISISGGDNEITVGENNVSTVTVAGNYVRLRNGANSTGAISALSGATNAYIDAGDNFFGTINLGTSTGAVVRFGPNSSGAVTTGSTGSSLVGQNTWWAAQSGVLADGTATTSLASGAALSGGWFDLAGWGSALAQATVSGTSPAYTLEVTVADTGHHPFYTATATGSATTVGLGPFVTGPAVQLVLTNTGANALTVQDLGFLLSEQASGAANGGAANGGVATSVTVSNTSSDPVPTTTSPQLEATTSNGTTVAAGGDLLAAAVTAPAAGTMTLRVALETASVVNVATDGTHFFGVNQGTALAANALYSIGVPVSSGDVVQYSATSATTVGNLAVWFERS